MYTDYFGLSEIPFSIAPNPEFLFMSERHKEALAHLTYGLGETGGFVLLTGEVGTGKTTVSRCMLAQLPENTQAAFILNPTLSSHELLATVCDELKIRYRKTGATLKTLTDKIQQKLIKNHEAGINTILIIDEAQHLKPEVLEQLRLLTNLETNTKKLLQVILIGQPELQQLLQRRDLRQLAQRITARYHLMPLTLAEVEQYIEHRLQVANCQQALFNKRAIKTVHQLSGGVPRLINLLCDRALLGAYGENKSQVDSKIVKQASQEALSFEAIKPVQSSHWQLNWQWLAPVFISLAIVIGFIAARADFTGVFTVSNEQQKTRTSASKAFNFNQEALVASNNLSHQSLALFKAWRIALDETITEPCQLASQYQLSCYWYRGNLPQLAKLTYPAVLKLYNNQGQAFYGLLSGVEFNGNKVQKVQLQFAEQSIWLNNRELDDVWRGGAMIFWQAPAFLGQNMRQINAQSELTAIQWLEQQLSDKQQRPTRTVTSFDPLLVNQLNQFQRQQGLAVNNFADTITLLALTNQVAQGLPIFAIQREEN